MLKVKEGFVLRTVAKQHVVVPTGEDSVNFNGVITLNDSGKALFELLQQGTDKASLSQKLIDTYDVDDARAKEDVDAFLDTLKAKHVLR